MIIAVASAEAASRILLTEVAELKNMVSTLSQQIRDRPFESIRDRPFESITGIVEISPTTSEILPMVVTPVKKRKNGPLHQQPIFSKVGVEFETLMEQGWYRLSVLSWFE